MADGESGCKGCRLHLFTVYGTSPTDSLRVLKYHGTYGMYTLSHQGLRTRSGSRGVSNEDSGRTGV